jgi:ferredoxin
MSLGLQKTTLPLKEDITMALRVDEELCSGCELCVQICPDVFEMDSTGISRIKEGADENLDCVDEAIDSCPSAAIIRE